MKRFCEFLVGRSLTVMVVCMATIVLAVSGNAQSVGPRPNIESVASRRPVERRGTIELPETVKYRPAMKRLGLNEELLVSQYREAIDLGVRVKLRDVIVGYLVGSEITDQERVAANVDEILRSMRDKKKRFESALETTFSLQKDDRIRRIRAAEVTLKNAMQEK